MYFFESRIAKSGIVKNKIRLELYSKGFGKIDPNLGWSGDLSKVQLRSKLPSERISLINKLNLA
jgi:hypothetical protein